MSAKDLQASEIHIGEAIFAPRLRQVTLRGRVSRLQPKAAAVLAEMAARRGEPVSRQVLIEACWSGDAGSDEALTQVIAQLRRTLGDDPREPKFIETIAKDGYRLIAPLQPEANDGASGAESVDRRNILVLALAVVIALALLSLVDPHAVRHFLKHANLL